MNLLKWIELVEVLFNKVNVNQLCKAIFCIQARRRQIFALTIDIIIRVNYILDLRIVFFAHEHLDYGEVHVFEVTLRYYAYVLEIACID